MFLVQTQLIEFHQGQKITINVALALTHFLHKNWVILTEYAELWSQDHNCTQTHVLFPIMMFFKMLESEAAELHNSSETDSMSC